MALKTADEPSAKRDGSCDAKHMLSEVLRSAISKAESAGPPRAKARRSWRGQPYDRPLKWNANSRNRDAIPLCPPLAASCPALPRLTGVVTTASRSSATILSTFARISSVGSTQSIGIELQPSVGQLSRSGPLPRVPPATWICRPVMILPQTRQKRFSSSERHWRN